MMFRTFPTIASFFILSCSCSSISSQHDVYSEFGKDPDVQTFLNCVVKNYKSSIVSCEIDQSRIDTLSGMRRNITPLAWMIEHKYITPKTIVEMNNKGYDFNSKYSPGSTPIGNIISSYPIEYMESLLNNGYDVNKCNYSSILFQCPIFAAVFSGELDKVRLLVDNDANIEIYDGTFGKTPFLYSLTNNRFDLALYFINIGSNIDAISIKPGDGVCAKISNAAKLNLDRTSYDIKSKEIQLKPIADIDRLSRALKDKGVDCVS